VAWNQPRRGVWSQGVEGVPSAGQRPKWPPRRAALWWVAGCVAGALLTAGAPRSAAMAPPVASGWGLSVHPAFSGETSLPEGHFTYALPPGATVHDALVVESSVPAPVRVMVYGADLRPIPGGGVTPAAVGQAMAGVGRWLAVRPLTAPVPAGGRVRVPFVLSVPAHAAPGSYNGAVVAQGRVGTTAAGVAVGVRVALIVHLVVVASAHPQLSLGPVALLPPAGSAAVTVHNEGNVNLGVSGVVTVRNPAGAEVGRVSLGPAGLYVIPGGTAVLRGTIRWPHGSRQITAIPAVTTTVGTRPGPTYSGPAAILTRPAFPPWAVALAACAVTGIAAAGIAIGRRRRSVG
jgi:hypothetical protein